MELTYREVAFGADGSVEGLPDEIAAPGTSDLVVMAHGWNNDATAARSLFEAWRSRLGEGLAALGAQAPERVGVLGVLWPSLGFADPSAAPTSVPAQTAQLRGLLHGLAARADDHDREALLAAGEHVDRLDSPEARDAFAAHLVGVIDAHAGDPDEPSVPLLASASMLDAAAGVSAGVSAGDLDPAPDAPPDGALAAPSGGAAGLFGADSVLGGALQLANFTTYYVMKDRAGVVGERGLGPLLADRLSPAGPRLHLVGHSFGARLATAAALAAARHDPHLTTRSITLLQAAFSHYAFSAGWGDGRTGSFRGLLTDGGLTGPMLISHTRQDAAVGIAYALASRLRKQIGAAVGDAGDPYGGLGSNGAQLTPEVVDDEWLLRPTDERYTLTPRRVHNLLADRFVHDHGDVRGPEIGHALAAAVACGAST